LLLHNINYRISNLNYGSPTFVGFFVCGMMCRFIDGKS